MTKIVINECFGGFVLSAEAQRRLKEVGVDVPGYSSDTGRGNPELVRIVEEMGPGASGGYARLAVVEVPDGVGWHVHEYDGFETVHENHRSWTSDGESENC
jgi:hypothetical protein